MKKIFHRHILSLCIVLSGTHACAETASFTLGVENIPTSLMRTVCPDAKNDSSVVGLITNQTGVDQQGTRTVDILLHRGLQVNYIFAPEHGLSGVLAERDVHDSVDKKTGIPVVSLYGNGSGKMISPEYMGKVDCLVFDIQDSGMRHYTYISTMLNTMKIAAEHNKPFVVLDRPNPLGSLVEGPLVEPGLISFISIAPIPLRHGMTIGELAWYFNRYVLDKPAPLHVVKMKGYDRTHGYVGNLVHQLSPNLQSLQSVDGYSFLGLLGEIEPFDVGVGTHMAFRCIALPESMHVPAAVWQRLQSVLSSYGVKSFPYYHMNEKNKKHSKGLRLEFSDMSNVHAFELLIAILKFFKKEKIAFSFSAAFNKAVGTAKVQEVIAGTLSVNVLFNQIIKDLQQFHKRARHSFFYQPVPVIFNATKKQTS